MQGIKFSLKSKFAKVLSFQKFDNDGGLAEEIKHSICPNIFGYLEEKVDLLAKTVHYVNVVSTVAHAIHHYYLKNSDSGLLQSSEEIRMANKILAV